MQAASQMDEQPENLLASSSVSCWLALIIFLLQHKPAGELHVLCCWALWCRSLLHCHQRWVCGVRVSGAHAGSATWTSSPNTCWCPG
jgi:hypothetical protein